jgi:type IV secretion system protein VirB8
MTDIAVDFRALPVLDQDRERYHQEVLSYHAHKTKDKASRARLWFYVALISLGLNILLTASLASLLPMKQLVPLYLVSHDDGTVDSGISLTDLGVDQAQKVIRASIWRYVAERESYSYADAKRRYDLVSLMSNESVRHDYQEWFLKSPDSPQKVFGKKGQISVHEISMSPIRDGVFLVRFYKVSHLYGEKDTRMTATATVQYELLNNAPASLVLDDPAALQVIRYQVEDNSP